MMTNITERMTEKMDEIMNATVKEAVTSADTIAMMSPENFRLVQSTFELMTLYKAWLAEMAKSLDKIDELEKTMKRLLALVERECS